MNTEREQVKIDLEESLADLIYHENRVNYWQAVVESLEQRLREIDKIDGV